MSIDQTPNARPHSAGLARNLAERHAIRKRRIIMALIVLIGVGIIIWDFLRPPRPAAPKPAPEAPAGSAR